MQMQPHAATPLSPTPILCRSRSASITTAQHATGRRRELPTAADPPDRLMHAGAVHRHPDSAAVGGRRSLLGPQHWSIVIACVVPRAARQRQLRRGCAGGLYTLSHPLLAAAAPPCIQHVQVPLHPWSHSTLARSRRRGHNNLTDAPFPPRHSASDVLRAPCLSARSGNKLF